MANIKKRWRMTKRNDSEKTPVVMLENGGHTGCQREIAEMYFFHIQKKIQELAKNLLKHSFGAMNTFIKLISRQETPMEFQQVTVREVYKIINKLKSSRSQGDSEFTNIFLKQIP